MKRSILWSMLWVAGVPAGVALLPACPGGEDACGEPQHYVGDASDEAWMTYVDAEDRIQIDDGNAATVTSPAAGEELDADGLAPMIAFTTPLTASVDRVPTPGVRWAAWVRSVFAPEAWAHLPPVTGDIHLLELEVPGEACPIRVFTTRTEWQMDEATWSLLRSKRGATIELVVTSMYMDENRITEGPYRASTPHTFRISP